MGGRVTYGVGNYGFLGVHGGGGCEEGGEGRAGDEGGGLGGSVGFVSTVHGRVNWRGQLNVPAAHEAGGRPW